MLPVFFLKNSVFVVRRLIKAELSQMSVHNSSVVYNMNLN